MGKTARSDKIQASSYSIYPRIEKGNFAEDLQKVSLFISNFHSYYFTQCLSRMQVLKTCFITKQSIMKFK